MFSASALDFVKKNPGVTPYMIRRLAATPSMLAKIDGHQRHIAEVYGITKEQARWPCWRMTPDGLVRPVPPVPPTRSRTLWFA